MATRQKNKYIKNSIRTIYIASRGILALLNCFLLKRKELSVYYGGARQGNVGGPLVKVKRLMEYFPEKKWGYNIIYTLSNTPYLPKYAYSIIKKQNIPVVHNQNGVFYSAWYDGDCEAENKRMGISYHAADWVFYQSEFCRDAANRFLGIRTGPGEVLFNAIDTEHFKPRINKNYNNHHPVFLVTGKISEHLFYRIDSTVRAISILIKSGVDAKLIIAGWMDEFVKRETRALVDALNIKDNVEYLGVYSQEDAPHIYQMADVYVMMKHNDPCPNTVLEALACGIPVVYSDSGGVRELVGDKAGIGVLCEQSWVTVCTPSPDEIAAAMTVVLTNLESFSAEARIRAVEKFNIKKWIDRHQTIFNKLSEK